jgi:glycosyltransferase involved in cell wall biosynthesis
MEALFYLADQNPQRDRSLGITEYSRGLISSLRDSFGLRISVLTSKSSYQGEGAVTRISLPFGTGRAVGRLAADFLHPLWLPRAALVHYPKGFLPGLRPRAGLLCGTVHDVILQHYADRYPRARSRLAYTYWLGVLQRSLPRFDFIFTVSEFSAAAIREFCSRHHLACPPLRVTYEGCRWENEPVQPVDRIDRAIHLGSIEPHKRTASLVQDWKRIKPANLQLLIVGAVSEEVRRSIAGEPSIELVPPQSPESLRTLIAQSRALLLPSEIEGFGLPAVEAYALGIPVAYVRGTAVEEILGPHTPGGFFLDEPDSFSSALESILALSPEQIFRKRAELTARFSWEECGRKTMAAYREFLGVV